MPRNYSAKVPVTVDLEKPAGGTVKYAFGSRIQKDSNRAILGHTLIDFNSIDVTNLIAGCTAPKPARASKREPEANIGYESSLCSTGQIGALRADGWSIKPGVPFGVGGSSDLSHTYYVIINGNKVAWKSSKPPGSVNINEVGTRIATATDDDLILGANFPKLPRFKRTIDDPEDSALDTFSILGDPDANPPEASGWLRQSRRQRLTRNDFATTKL